MLILPIEQAEPGMRLAVPIANPDRPDQDLLKRGYELEPSVVTHLKQLGINYLYIEYPGLEELDKFLIPQISPARLQVYNVMRESIRAGQQRSQAGVSYHAYLDAAKSLLETLLEQGPGGVYMDQIARLGTDAIGHGTAVAHLALMLGLKLENYLIQQRRRLPPSQAKDVMNLGVAAMLHDAGKLQLPEHLRQYTEVAPPANDAERREWETHTRIAYDMVHKDLEPSAACAILNHHQHFDGTGFPETEYTDGTKMAMAGQKIHVFARILQAANLFDRLTGDAEGRRRTNLEILHLMRTTYAKWIDPAVLGTLAHVCPPFPPGSQLQLGDGTRAVVVQPDPVDPYRPFVRRVLAGDVIDEKRFSLKAPGSPGIVRVGIVDVNVEDLIPREKAA